MNAIISPSSCLFLVVALVGSNTSTAQESEEPVLLKVSDSAAERLPEDTVVTVSAAGKDRRYASRIGEMPMTIPWRYFVRSDATESVPVGAFIDFSNDEDERILAVLLSSDLFDRPRTVDIVLKRPETFVKPARGFIRPGFRYHALISQRMQYSDVPKWDANTRKFLKPSPPVLHIYRASTGALLRKSEMRSMCYGYGWALPTDFPPDLPHGTELRIVVVHDAGDLFGELSAECSYTHQMPRDIGVQGSATQAVVSAACEGDIPR